MGLIDGPFNFYTILSLIGINICSIPSICYNAYCHGGFYVWLMANVVRPHNVYQDMIACRFLTLLEKSERRREEK